MKHLKMMQKRKWLFACLMVLAVCALVFSGVQTSRAALTYFSANYTAEMTISQIGITLVENGNKVSWRDYAGNNTWNTASGALLGNMLAEGEEVQIGREYPEALSVSNSGEIEEYVRVILYRYWEGPDGRATDLSPSLIDLHLTGNGWVVDESVSTEERIVLYYTRPLAVGETTAPLSDTIRIDGSLASRVTETRTQNAEGYTVITRTFDYNGVQFMLEAEADGVQTHNAPEAIKSAWGVNVSVGADGSLSLN